MEYCNKQTNMWENFYWLFISVFLYASKHSSRPIHNIQGRMEEINRNLSVRFNSKLFTGIKHEDMLSELEKEINLEDIKSNQMTEKSCIVTLKSEQAK